MGQGGGGGPALRRRTARPAECSSAQWNARPAERSSGGPARARRRHWGPRGTGREEEEPRPRAPRHVLPPPPLIGRVQISRAPLDSVAVPPQPRPSPGAVAAAPCFAPPLGEWLAVCCGSEGGWPECGARRSQGLHVFLPCEIPSWTPHRGSLSGRPSASHSESPEAGENPEVPCASCLHCPSSPPLAPASLTLLLIPSSSISALGEGETGMR